MTEPRSFTIGHRVEWREDVGSSPFSDTDAASVWITRRGQIIGVVPKVIGQSCLLVACDDGQMREVAWPLVRVVTQ